MEVILAQSPPTSAFVRVTQGEDALWGLQEHLTAGVIDALNVANWQRGGDRRAPKPKPLIRPGVGPTRIGKAPLSMDEMRVWLGWSAKDGEGNDSDQDE